MTANDQPPDEPNEPVVTLRIPRGTLILIAALVFLALTILLIAVYPPGTQPNRPTAGPAGQTPAVTAEGTPTEVSAQEPTVTDYPAPAITDPALALTPGTSAQAPTAGPDGYPAPNVPTIAPQQAAGTTLPTFAPATGLAGEQETAIANATATAEVATLTAPTRTLPNTPIGQPTQPAAPPTIPSFPTPTTPGQPTVPAPIAPTAPVPTVPFQPTDIPPPQPQQPPPPTVIRPTAAPTATPINADILRGNLRWTLDRSPIILRREQRLAPGASLIIDPGVEVRLAPGVAFYVQGVLSAAGQPGQPVRFVNSGGRWDAIYVVPGGTAILEHTELRGGGNGGTLIAAQGGTLTLRRTRVTDNGGQIRAENSRVELLDNEISGNDMPYGSAVEINAPVGPVNLSGNRVGGNRLSAGNAPFNVRNASSNGMNLTIRRNLLIGEQGPDLLLFTNGPLSGDITCNTLINGTNGLQLKSEVPVTSLGGLLVRDNLLDDHTPPIEPIYLKYGIGRGATSDLALAMNGNYWGSELGPYDPQRHADGRGDSVGVNIAFDGWLTAPPGCIPPR